MQRKILINEFSESSKLEYEKNKRTPNEKIQVRLLIHSRLK